MTVFQVCDSLADDPSRPLQSDLPSSSPSRFHRKLARVAESESSDVAIGLDRPFSDDVPVNVSPSSSRDKGHSRVRSRD